MKGYFNGASYADLDNDGNLDLVINSLNAPAIILKNNASGKNYITVSFNGDGSNKFGVGAKAYLFAKNGMQYQQLMPTRGFQSSSDLRLHFGLDSLKSADSLLIVWPDQKLEVMRNIPASKQIVVSQKNASAKFDYKSFFPKKQDAFEDISQKIHCS